MSNNLLITPFTVDTLAPTISQTSQIPFVSFDSTPSVNINTSEAGTFVFGGACTSSQTAAVIGNNTVVIDHLANGFYSNCTITLTDAAGYMSNVVTLNSFFVDATAPVISLVTPIVTPSTDSTPNLTFSSSKSGTITYGGSCSGTLPVVVGNNTITLNNLVPATYTNCTITVTDVHTNKSNVLTIPSFTINIAAGAPVLAIVTPVVTPSTSTLPVVTFSSSKAGTIIY